MHVWKEGSCNCMISFYDLINESVIETGERNSELWEEEEQDSHSLRPVQPPQLPSPEEPLRLLWLPLSPSQKMYLTICLYFFHLLCLISTPTYYSQLCVELVVIRQLECEGDSKEDDGYW
ncbi:hypothetical protein Vadar_017194 [Vaccinium darrowii]|uniref:Uncharacterized protein n=1 Tax=Vaccinium darrowii TaxID=229202 RepID=A0ACB7YNG1_9ERIC|nr:hypothetical protein Vadar_017194 [Vaccinium darrowii]